MTVLLRVDSVSRYFSGPVLREVSLELRAGELIALVGGSGSGKSALIALLAGFDEPDSGRITIAGQPGGRQLPWSTLAVLPQSFGLLDELTLEENVATPTLFGPASKDRPGAFDRAVEVLGRLGIGHLARRYPAEVSVGQRQRVAFARAVSVRPSLLLADEPTAHLDRAATALVVHEIEDFVADGGCCLVATHDQELVGRAHRRLELANGKLVES
jgi:putative ABC transport system ATP-binding protein